MSIYKELAYVVGFIAIVGIGGQTAQAEELSVCAEGEFKETGECGDPDPAVAEIDPILKITPEEGSLRSQQDKAIESLEFQLPAPDMTVWEVDAPTLEASGFPTGSCRSGYFRVAPRLCMSALRGPDSFANAMALCQRSFGSVADYGAWRYRLLFGDGIRAPVGWWLGPITDDDTALYVNLNNPSNFDGETSRFDQRNYACAHDVD